MIAQLMGLVSRIDDETKEVVIGFCRRALSSGDPSEYVRSRMLRMLREDDASEEAARRGPPITVRATVVDKRENLGGWKKDRKP